MNILFGKDYPISSPQGNRINPITKEPEYHTGIDFSTPIGTPLYAPESGTVNNRTDQFGGLFIQLFGASGRWHFVHLDSFVGVSGRKVTTGELIGYTGNSGQSTGAHTHVDLFDGKGWKDVYKILQSLQSMDKSIPNINKFKAKIKKDRSDWRAIEARGYEDWWSSNGYHELLNKVLPVVKNKNNPYGRQDVIDAVIHQGRNLADWYTTQTEYPNGGIWKAETLIDRVKDQEKQIKNKNAQIDALEEQQKLVEERQRLEREMEENSKKIDDQTPSSEDTSPNTGSQSVASEYAQQYVNPKGIKAFMSWYKGQVDKIPNKVVRSFLKYDIFTFVLPGLSGISGYLLGLELESELYAQAAATAGVILGLVVKVFLTTYDKNEDGRLDKGEISYNE